MGGVWERQDLVVLAVSFVYIGGVIGAIYGWGIADGWNSHNPLFDHDSNRFWPKPGTNSNGTYRTDNCTAFDARYDAPLRKATVDCYARWYYWQLPRDQANAVTRSVVWVLYTVHQLLHWICIWFSMEDKSKMVERKEPIYAGKLRWYNWLAIAGTFFFHIIHLIQTHTTYDGLAQDLIVQSNQGSAIMMLIFIMCIEYRNRGMFLGWPNQFSTDRVALRLRLSADPMAYIRKYHGYAFSWVVIYTFWYHPMENTYGHIMGFIHTFFVMVQGSLMYQKVHLNKFWRLLIETWVWFHGFSVAIMIRKGVWWMELSPYNFGLGFGTIFFVTQIFSLPFWYKISPYWRIIPPVLWFIFAFAIILGNAAVPNRFLMGIFVIPAGQWGCAFLSWLISYIFILCLPTSLSTLGPVFQASITVLIYSAFIAISFVFQLYATTIDMAFMLLTYIMVLMFLVGCIFTFFCFPLPESIQRKIDQKASAVSEKTVEIQSSSSKVCPEHTVST